MSAPSLVVLRHDSAGRRRVRFGQVFWSLTATCCAGLILMAPPLTLGARFELLLNPVLRGQVIKPETVVLSGDRLCWTWVRDKLRAPDVVDLDVILVAANGDRSFPEIFDEYTGVPWHRSGALAAGHHESRNCVQRPNFLAPGEGFRVQQTVSYAGLLNLWDLRVALPDVTSP